MCLRICIELWAHGKTLCLPCVELTYFTALQICKVTGTLSTVKNNGFIKEQTC